MSEELPEGWIVEPFSQVARYATGRTPARANTAYWKHGVNQVPWVTISDMEEYGSISNTAEGVSEVAFKDVFRGRIVSAGTLLMSFKLTIGRVATLSIPACHNEAIISIYPRDGVDQRYLGYFLSQVDYSDHQDRQVKGNTLNQSKIDRIPVSLPPSNEQHSIADVLDHCRKGINTERAAEEIASELKRAVMTRLFTRGMRGETQQETEFGAISDSWDTELLDRVAHVQTGIAKGRKFTEAEMIQVPYLCVANVQDGYLNLGEMKTIPVRPAEISRYLLQVDDVVLTEGGDFDKLGRGCIWRGELDLCLHQNHVFAVRLDREKILPEFFAYLAQSPYGKAYFLKVAHKTTNLACINTNKLKAFPVIFPLLDEQREIVTILDALDRKIDLHRQKRDVLEELFRSLLHKLMTGEIRVSNLDLSALPAASARLAETMA